MPQENRLINRDKRFFVVATLIKFLEVVFCNIMVYNCFCCIKLHVKEVSI